MDIVGTLASNVVTLSFQSLTTDEYVLVIDSLQKYM